MNINYTQELEREAFIMPVTENTIVKRPDDYFYITNVVEILDNYYYLVEGVSVPINKFIND
jgi:hypothetical protein